MFVIFVSSINLRMSLATTISGDVIGCTWVSGQAIQYFPKEGIYVYQFVNLERCLINFRHVYTCIYATESRPWTKCEVKSYPNCLENSTYSNTNHIPSGDPIPVHVGYGVTDNSSACDILHITPAQKVIDNLGNNSIPLTFRKVGPLRSQALAAALLASVLIWWRGSSKWSGWEVKVYFFLGSSLDEKPFLFTNLTFVFLCPMALFEK